MQNSYQVNSFYIDNLITKYYSSKSKQEIYKLKNYLSKIHATLHFNNSIKIQPQGKRSLVTIQKPGPT